MEGYNEFSLGYVMFEIFKERLMYIVYVLFNIKGCNCMDYDDNDFLGKGSV